MGYLILLLGMVLAGSGGYALLFGFDDLTTERGMTLTLGGTIGLSVGIVVIALSFALFSLKKIVRRLEAVKQQLANLNQMAGSTPLASKAVDPELLDAVEAAIQAPPKPAPSNGSGMPAAGMAAGAAILGAGAVVAATLADQADPKAKAPGGNDALAGAEIPMADIPAIERKSEPKSDFGLGQSQADISHVLAELGEEPHVAARSAADEMPAPAVYAPDSFEAAILRELDEANPPVEADKPVKAGPAHGDKDPMERLDIETLVENHAAPTQISEVIGAYESAGVTYTLHADGSVVATAGTLRERYDSLEALRAAFERGESAFSP